MNGLPDITLAPARLAPEGGGTVYFIGNATVLIRYAGFTVLTDPNFVHRHEKVPIGYGLTATRQTDPAIDIQALPSLDLVVLSHFHGDHFDQVAEHELDKNLPIVTPTQAADELRQRGFTGTRPLEKWDTVMATKGPARLRVTATPGRHGPPVVSFALPDVMGSLLEFDGGDGQAPFRMYVSGDTLVYEDLEEIPRRFPDVDLALLHLGGTTVLGVMVTMDGKQGVELIRLVNPRLAIPVHFDDYDVFASPLEDFQREVREAGLEPRVHYLRRGETYTFAPARSPV